MTEKITKRQVAKVLREASRAIEKHGFYQGWFGSERDGFCAIGAINYATTGFAPIGDYGGPGDFAREALRKRLLDAVGTYSIAQFNDSDSTKKEDITGLMRRTARELEHGGEL